MAREYSDSIPPSMAPLPCLVVDSGSPTASVALALEGGARLERHMRQSHASGALLQEVRDLLAEARSRPEALRSLVGLRGPGSFTGLRVGLSTLLGLHEALDIPVTGISTLETLASLPAGGLEGPARVVAAVDALRGEWFLQPFRIAPGSAPRPTAEARCLAPSDLRGLGAGDGADLLVGFGAARLAELAGLPPDWRVVEPEALAGVAAEVALTRGLTWSPDLVCEPLYLRPPAVTRPG